MARLLLVALFALTATITSMSASAHPCSPSCHPNAASSRQDPTPDAPRTPITVTGRQTAHISIDLTSETPVLDRHPSAVALVVRPDTFSSDELYIVMVYVEQNGGLDDAQPAEFLGGFTWHMPPQIGEPSTFYVNAPESLRVASNDSNAIELGVRLEAVDPNVTLQNSRLTILDATLVP